MKNTSKILVLVILLTALLTCMAGLTASAEETETKFVYLNAWDWNNDSTAWFQAYTWNHESNENSWVTFTQIPDSDYYFAEIPANRTRMIFLRKGPDHGAGTWDCWNRTGDITISADTNCFTITAWNGDSTNNNYSIGSWSSYTFTVAGDSALCGSEWSVTDTSNDMTFNADGSWTKTYTGVAAGSYELKCAQNHAWDVCYGDANGYDNYIFSVVHPNSTVTVTLKGSTVTVDVVEGACSGGTATCTAKATCEFCKEEYGDLAPHSFDNNICSVCDAIEINETTFPDETFRNIILSAEFDMNQDGLLSTEEIARVTNFWLEGRGFTDLTGINYFTELTELDAQNNNFTSLDLSGLTKLESLYLNANPNLESLNLTGCTALRGLYLTSCRNLATLNIQDCVALQYLDLSSCSKLANSFKVGHLTELIYLSVDGIWLRELDLSNNTKLEELIISNTGFTTLDLSNNPEIYRFEGASLIPIKHCGVGYVNLNEFVDDISKILSVTNGTLDDDGWVKLDDGATELFYDYDTGAEGFPLSVWVRLSISDVVEHSYVSNITSKDATHHYTEWCETCRTGNEETVEAHSGTDDNNCSTAVVCSCGYTITAAKEHAWNNACDTDCNNADCTWTRTTSHVEGAAVEENKDDPTCTAAGSYDSVVYCSVCNYEISRETLGINATGHSYTSSVTKEPTYTEKGTMTYTCSACGDSYTEELPIKTCEHSYNAVVTPATCTAKGYTTYTCKECGDSYVGDETEMLDHTWGEGVVTTAPTCTADGTRTFTCSCGATKTETEKATGHNYTAAVTAPTCTAGGYTTYTCSSCGDSYVDDEVNALGHTEVVDAAVAPTCTTTGLTEGSHCSVCDETIVEQTVVAALGHTAGTEVKENEVPSTCTSKGSYDKVVYCTVCNEKLSSEKVTLDFAEHSYSAVVTNPTCTEEGYTTYTCSCGDSYTADKTAALGHAYNGDNTCDTCGYLYDVVIYFENNWLWTNVHVYYWNDEGENAVWPGEALGVPVGENIYGSEIYKFQVPAGINGVIFNGTNDKNVEDQTPDIVELVNGTVFYMNWDNGNQVGTYTHDTHNIVTTEGKTPTCTETGLTEGKHCSVCGLVEVEQETIDALGHDMVIDEAVDPTCTETGLTEGKHCSVCGTVTVAQTEIPAKGHTEETVEGKDATCTETGLTNGVKCSVCGETLTEQETIPALGHTEETVAGKDATCTETGLTNGVKCSVCGETLTAQTIIPATGHVNTTTVTVDETCVADGSVTVTCACGTTVSTTVIPATGHAWGEWAVTTPAVCTEKGVETRTCSNCDATETQDITAIGHNYTAVVTDPTCTEDGYTTHTCANCNNSYTSNTVEAKGHSYTSAVTTQPTYTTEGVRTFTCSACAHSYMETIPVITCEHSYNTVVTDPTCTAGGYTTYTCSKCGYSYNDDYTTKLDHTWGEGVVTTAPTCTVDGVRTFTCSCGATKTEVESATGHDYSTVVTAPTCTEGGYTTYTCSCGDTYVANRTEATGHVNTTTVTVDATCTAEGSVTVTCDCGVTVSTTVIPATGHAYGEWVVTQEPTEDREGSKTKLCADCGDVVTESVPALDHTHDYSAVVTAPTCTEGGYTTHTCSCGDSYVDGETEALKHDFVDGACSRCDAEDPDHVGDGNDQGGEDGKDNEEENDPFIDMLPDFVIEILEKVKAWIHEMIQNLIALAKEKIKIELPL